MGKPTIPVEYQFTQAEITAGAANALSGVRIVVVGADNQPTGVVYESGAAGAAPVVSAAGIKNNLAATIAPATTDDSGDGYAVGSRWIDTTADESYICVDSTLNAAVWSKSTVGTIDEVSGLQTALDGKSANAHNHDMVYAAITHGTNVSNPHSVTKTQVGLGAVDNTADTAKPVSVAQQTALDGKSATSHTHNNISVRVTRNSAQSLSSAGTIVSWDTVDHEVGATTLWDVANPTRLTAPVAGTYLVVADIAAESDSIGQITILKNGITVHNGTAPRFWTGSGSTSALIRLSIGDYVECRVSPATTVNSIVAAERHYLAMVFVSL